MIQATNTTTAQGFTSEYTLMGGDYAFKYWEGKNGQKRIYVKKAGADFGVYDCETKEFSKTARGAWPSISFSKNFIPLCVECCEELMAEVEATKVATVAETPSALQPTPQAEEVVVTGRCSAYVAALRQESAEIEEYGMTRRDWEDSI